MAQGAIAQPNPNVVRDSSGAVRVDQNAFDIRTGPLTNTSNIPLPAILPATTSEGVAVPVSRGQAPNSIEIRPNVDYINESFNTLVNQAASGTTYTLKSDTLQLSTRFSVNRRPGDHAYGEGIAVNVSGPNGSVSDQSIFVRGDRTTLGQNGQPLPESGQINVSYGASDRVQLRVLNIVRDGAAPAESGIYFSEDGQIIVEDLRNGGDRDFNDGDYVDIVGGRGQAEVVGERTTVTQAQTTNDTPLDPTTRDVVDTESEVVDTFVEFDTMLGEEKVEGEVELPETAATRIAHADGVRSAIGEQLIYNRYAATAQIRLGTDGLGITGQLPPLINNPKAPPTLLSGNINFNPTVGDNNAGLSATVGLTQFFNPTHRQAADVFGNPIVNPDPDGPRLVEPMGLFSNRQVVGYYVPPVPEQTVSGSQLSSISGIFDLPTDQPIVIEPADPQSVGRGNAAYTDNVGGLLIERATGVSFVPQWTGSGYAQSSITLTPGEAQRIIYALVPQQAGQNLQIGETYAVTEGANGYQIADGGFSIISADRQPQNFVQEMAEVYAVEDTVSGGNQAIAIFNGIQGVYAEQPGGPLTPTVDVTSESEADARVGNRLYSPVTLASVEGQSLYTRTTRAGGFYLGGSLSAGVGNQRDTFIQTNMTTTQLQTDRVTLRTVNTFSTPQTQRETIFTESSETRRIDGTAFFDINSQGELKNARVQERASQVISSSPPVVTNRNSVVVMGQERLDRSVTSEVDRQALDTITLEQDISTTERSESRPNFSAVEGELALGGVFNFGNTPWTTAANTLRAELFARDTIFGRSNGETEVGWRAEVVYHPFGEVQRSAYEYDPAGNAIALYQTEAVVDAAGNPMMQTLTDASGKSVDVPVGQFAVDEAGDRIVQTVGTGIAQGPGVYLRLEDVFSGDNDDGLELIGGIQFSF